MQAIVVGWRKGMASMAYTYLLDIEGDELWFGHLGKGGAHWEPNTPAFRLGAISPESSYTDQQKMHQAASGLGMAVGKTVLGKFLEEIGENLESYRKNGREALASSKRTWSTSKSAFGADAELAEKLPRGGPPAVAGMGPFIKGTQNGKDVYLAVTPDSPLPAHGLLALLG